MEQNKKSILIIDDEKLILNFFQELLSNDGYLVKVARTGEEGLRAIEKECFNLIIVDKNLPGLSGLEVVKSAKKLNPNTEIIIITAYGSMESAIKAIELGVNRYLTKPFEDINRVRENIKNALEKQDRNLKFKKLLGETVESNKRLREHNLRMQSELSKMNNRYNQGVKRKYYRQFN